MSELRTCLLALICGALFGAGLVLSGMTDPAKVIGFLDIFGAWDASLVFVMLGAIGVHAVAYRLVPRVQRPLLAPHFVIPERRDIDARLVWGAVLFGVGWGIAGYCPGPAVVALGALRGGSVEFVLAMLAGMWLYAQLGRAWRGRATSQPQPQTRRG